MASTIGHLSVSGALARPRLSSAGPWSAWADTSSGRTDAVGVFNPLANTSSTPSSSHPRLRIYHETADVCGDVALPSDTPITAVAAALCRSGPAHGLVQGAAAGGGQGEGEGDEEGGGDDAVDDPHAAAFVVTCGEAAYAVTAAGPADDAGTGRPRGSVSPVSPLPLPHPHAVVLVSPVHVVPGWRRGRDNAASQTPSAARAQPNAAYFLVLHGHARPHGGVAATSSSSSSPSRSLTLLAVYPRGQAEGPLVTTLGTAPLRDGDFRLPQKPRFMHAAGRSVGVGAGSPSSSSSSSSAASPALHVSVTFGTGSKLATYDVRFPLGDESDEDAPRVLAAGVHELPKGADARAATLLPVPLGPALSRTWGCSFVLAVTADAPFAFSAASASLFPGSSSGAVSLAIGGGAARGEALLVARSTAPVAAAASPDDGAADGPAAAAAVVSPLPTPVFISPGLNQVIAEARVAERRREEEERGEAAAAAATAEGVRRRGDSDAEDADTAAAGASAGIQDVEEMPFLRIRAGIGGPSSSGGGLLLGGGSGASAAATAVRLTPALSSAAPAGSILASLMSIGIEVSDSVGGIVEEAAAAAVSAVTPLPGGVGAGRGPTPVTRALLVENAAEAAPTAAVPVRHVAPAPAATASLHLLHVFAWPSEADTVGHFPLLPLGPLSALGLPVPLPQRHADILAAGAYDPVSREVEILAASSASSPAVAVASWRVSFAPVPGSPGAWMSRVVGSSRAAFTDAAAADIGVAPHAPAGAVFALRVIEPAEEAGLASVRRPWVSCVVGVVDDESGRASSAPAATASPHPDGPTHYHGAGGVRRYRVAPLLIALPALEGAQAEAADANVGEKEEGAATTAEVDGPSSPIADKTVEVETSTTTAAAAAPVSNGAGPAAVEAQPAPLSVPPPPAPPLALPSTRPQQEASRAVPLTPTRPATLLSGSPASSSSRRSHSSRSATLALAAAAEALALTRAAEALRLADDAAAEAEEDGDEEAGLAADSARRTALAAMRAAGGAYGV
jgi:trimeric autotransporter adhesin